MPILKNSRWELFAQKVASGATQRQAYLDVYPNSQKYRLEIVDSHASELRSKVSVRSRIEELQDEAAKLAAKAQARNIMTTEERKEWLSDKIKDDEEKLSDRIKALDVLNKMDGEYTEKINISGAINNPFTELTTDELRKLADG